MFEMETLIRRKTDIIFGYIACLIVCVLSLSFGAFLSKKHYQNEISDLKTELEQAKAQIKVLEENQTIIYHADNWGGNYDN